MCCPGSLTQAGVALIQVSSLQIYLPAWLWLFSASIQVTLILIMVAPKCNSCKTGSSDMPKVLCLSEKLQYGETFQEIHSPAGSFHDTVLLQLLCFVINLLLCLVYQLNCIILYVQTVLNLV